MSNFILAKYGRVNTGWASRMQSDRILNPNSALCPVSNEIDLMGRSSNTSALITTNAGCNSATERTEIENQQRPSFSSRASLNIQGDQTNELGAVNQAIQSSFQLGNGFQVTDTKAVYNQASRDLQWSFLAKKVQYYKEQSGMTDLGL
jgi:hypothetical protein